MLLIALLHAWAPRPLLHWHDCPNHAKEAQAEIPSQSSDLPHFADASAADGCGFSLKRHTLPPFWSPSQPQLPAPPEWLSVAQAHLPLHSPQSVELRAQGRSPPAAV